MNYLWYRHTTPIKDAYAKHGFLYAFAVVVGTLLAIPIGVCMMFAVLIGLLCLL